MATFSFENLSSWFWAIRRPKQSTCPCSRFKPANVLIEERAATAQKEYSFFRSKLISPGG
jgi:hypothetical protein